MKVIRPIEITPAKILSSSATEIYSAWSSGTTYADGDKVLYNNRIYESLIGSNLNKQPDTNPTAWLDIAPSNKTAMFDSVVNTQTTATTSLTVTFQPGVIFDSVAFLNIKGASINVQVKSSPSGSVVYNQTINLDNTQIFDWYGYFFEDFVLRTEILFQNIPPYTTGTIIVTITGASGSTVAIGNSTVGSLVDIGGTQYGLTYGIRDYSTKETDTFGNIKIVQRAFSKRMSPTIFVDNMKLNYVSKVLENLRSTPTVFIATDDSRFEGTIILGFLKDWNIEINYPTYSLISAEIEGLI